VPDHCPIGGKSNFILSYHLAKVPSLQHSLLIVVIQIKKKFQIIFDFHFLKSSLTLQIPSFGGGGEDQKFGGEFEGNILKITLQIKFNVFNLL
jgi:hypothetical protein